MAEDLLIFQNFMIPFFNVASYTCFEGKKPGSFHSQNSNEMKYPEKVKVKVKLTLSMS
jgi:hypothetical protein